LLLKNYTACTEGGELTQNGNFEQGQVVWTEESQAPPIIRSAGLPASAHSGVWVAWLGGYHQAREKLYQQFVAPSDATSATLNYYVWMETEETAPAPIDRLLVRVYDGAGNVLWEDSVDNTATERVWLPRTISLTGLGLYASQTLRLSIEATTDSAETTSFLVDDVSLTVHCGALANSPGFTVTPTVLIDGARVSEPVPTKPALFQR
jgi:hypothetical protein